MIWKVRLFVERVGGKRLALVAAGVAVLIAAGAAFAVIRGSGDKKSTASTESTSAQVTANLFYLRALSPKVRIKGCAMYIHFTWKPHYHADQYIDAPALIMASGTGIDGSYRKRFTPKGVSIDLGPVSLTGGYQVWSAKVASLDGDPPGNDTTIQAAPPVNNKCG